MFDHSAQNLGRISIISILILILSACDSTNNQVKNTTDLITNTTNLLVTGSVGDGPITNSDVTLTDSSGNVLTTTKSTGSADYSAEISSNTTFPVLITSTGGIDIVTNLAPDFDMKTVIVDAEHSTANINPFSTMIVDAALSMEGGLTKENIDLATDYVYKNLNFGLDRKLIPSPISSEITPSNVASIIKASEAFGETLRRTQLELVKSDPSLTIDNVLNTLAVDIADGNIDGNGGNNNAKVAATFTVASANVLLETLSNRLIVNGEVATSALDASIQLTMPNLATNLTTSNVQINTGLITQTSIAVEAANTLTPSNVLPSLISALASIAPGTNAEQIAPLLTNDMKSALLTATNTVSTANDSQINAINSVLTDTGDTGDTGDTDVDIKPEILSIDNTLPANYQWSKLFLREKLYIDRDYTFKEIPPELEGLDVLQTANDDKTFANDDFISFYVNIPTVVYIAIDTRIVSLPEWLSDWTSTDLIIDTTDTPRNLYKKSFATGNITLGGNNSNTSMYSVIIQDPLGTTNSSNSGIATPIAVEDAISTDIETSVNFNVLQNDSGLDDGPISLSIIDQPAAGNAEVETDNTVTYIPNGTTAGLFSFVYQIEDIDGDIATTSVSVDVLCPNCANNVNLLLTWGANPETEIVDGYKIYYRVNSNNTTKLLADIPNSQNGFDPTNPSKSFNAGSDMGLMLGDSVCLSLQAYNVAGSSPSSTEVCSNI